jgi:hypothetical protein
VKILTFILPLFIIAWTVRVVGKVPPHVAQAFAEFLKGPYAVRQTMHLLRDMSSEIKEDTWTETIWGSPDPSKNKAVPLKLYFAKDVSHNYFSRKERSTNLCRMDGWQIMSGRL